MVLNRILRALLQPLLALLLIAGAAQAEVCLALDERIRTIASSSDMASIWEDPSDETSVAAPPSSSPYDPGFGHALHSPDVAFVLDQAKLIESSRAAYPTAPPLHRPCAAPPTGPPLV
ncbi:hypothetical protein J4G37_24505 [Microvirga sp. 3-52]|nr:hypothetical protein [Microvirga sp. 3-52]